METHNCTIEIPLKKATYEDIQALNINLQTQLFIKDEEIKALTEELCDTTKELEEAYERIKGLEVASSKLDYESTIYANRIDKAIEYIKEYLYINEETGEYCLTHTFDSSNLYELMKILKEYRV